MLKKVEVLPATLDLSFKKRVQTLAAEGSALAKSYRDLSERMLNFAQQIGKLSQRAYELDGGEQGQHHRHLRATIAKAIGSDNESVLSKWITIGTQAKALLPYKSYLPPQRECLYELALAAEDNRPIKKWVEQERLTVDSTVREVMALRRKKSRKKREKEYLASVTLSFQTYGEAADVLKELALSAGDFKIRSHQAFADALKAAIRDTDAYEEASKRFA